MTVHLSEHLWHGNAAEREGTSCLASSFAHTLPPLFLFASDMHMQDVSAWTLTQTKLPSLPLL